MQQGELVAMAEREGEKGAIYQTWVCPYVTYTPIMYPIVTYYAVSQYENIKTLKAAC